MKMKKAKRVRKAGRRTGPVPQKLHANEVIERGIPGFRALQYRCKLTYYDVVSITTGVSSAGTYIYSANGLYDPDVTSTGHQPMSFDQMMLSFEHYCVLGAKMTANFHNTTTVTTMGCSISLNAGTSPTTVVSTLVENGVMVRDRLAQAPYDDSVKTLTMPIRIGRFLGIPNVLNDDTVKGGIAANPTEQEYFHLSVWNPDTATQYVASVEVYIEYDAVFLEPRKNSASLASALRRMIIAEEKERKC